MGNTSWQLAVAVGSREAVYDEQWSVNNKQFWIWTWTWIFKRRT